MPPETPFCPARSVELLLPLLFCSKRPVLDDGDPKAHYIGEVWICAIRTVKAMEKLIQISVISDALKAAN